DRSLPDPVHFAGRTPAILIGGSSRAHHDERPRHPIRTDPGFPPGAGGIDPGGSPLVGPLGPSTRDSPETGSTTASASRRHGTEGGHDGIHEQVPGPGRGGGLGALLPGLDDGPSLLGGLVRRQRLHPGVSVYRPDHGPGFPRAGEGVANRSRRARDRRAPRAPGPASYR